MAKRILIVEDDWNLLEKVKAFLKRNGFEILTAFDGMSGLQIVRKEKPDLVLLDLMIPKVDGYKVCRLIKNDQNMRDVPIVIISARSSPADEKMGKELGANGYLSKPYDFKIMLLMIKDLLVV